MTSINQQQPILPVSLIVPCHSNASLLNFLSSLSESTHLPKQLIIVNSLLSLSPSISIPSHLDSILSIVSPPSPLFPGGARNFGLSYVNQPFCSFLDIATKPPPHWLSSAYQLLILFNEIDYVPGRTKYLALNYQQSLFIAATYGVHPLSTVPGSIFRTNSLRYVGYFFNDIRAGEDTEWLIRLQHLGLRASSFSAPSLLYSSVPSSLPQLIFKWFRNYRSCSAVVYHLEAQKLIYTLSICTLIVYIAFSWNAIFAGWVETDFFYISNITKIVFFSLLATYFLFRGIYLPYRKGVSIMSILPFNWLPISFISLLIDSSKFFAFFCRKPPAP